ncbi:MAG: hypothetical protein QOH86_1231, partial [Sphingomonadales bacterium]|nr:hypothetical protein [Sphingomonadales bacterium]
MLTIALLLAAAHPDPEAAARVDAVTHAIYLVENGGPANEATVELLSQAADLLIAERDDEFRCDDRPYTPGCG